MKKVNYKAINVNKLDWDRVKNDFGDSSASFSVDVAKNDFFGLLTNQDTGTFRLIKWTHPQDTPMLLTQLCEHLKFKQLEVVMEPTGTYGDALRWQFIQRGMPVYRVNPKHTHDQAESFDGVPSSHDAKAAYIIADLHQRGKSTLWQEDGNEKRDLRALVNELEIHQTIHRANQNRLAALLMRHWPELEDILTLNTVSALTLLASYGDPHSIQCHAEEALTTLQKAGGRLLDSLKCKAAIQSAKTTLGIPCTSNERIYIQQLAQDLIRTYRASQAVEKRIKQANKAEPERTHLVKLCGHVTTVALISRLGDLRDYADTQSLLKACGLNLKEHSSGKKKGQLGITKRGSGKVRFYLYWLALRLVKNDDYLKCWYQNKVARDGGRKKGKAIIAVMRKLVKALWHVAQGHAFDSKKLFTLESMA